MSKNPSMPKPNRLPGVPTLFLVILIAHVVLSMVYWRLTPFGVPPDEGNHGLYVRTIVETRSFPVFDPSDRVNYEAHQPPLYYLLGVPFFALGKVVGFQDPAEMVRALSIILGLCSIIVIYRTVKLAFPDDRNLALSAASFVALIPIHVMLSSSVGNDILLELVFGLFLLVSTLILTRGITLWRTLLLGGVLGMGVLTKTTALVLAPIPILLLLILWRRGTISARDALDQILPLSVVFIMVCGWWVLRNCCRYHDPFALGLFAKAFGHTAKPEYFLSRGFTPAAYSLFVATWTFCSFWGVFGHMKYFMPAPVYWVLGIWSLAVGGAGILGIRAIARRDSVRRDLLLVYNVVLALVALAFVAFNVQYFQAQGRYLYPAILPISVWTVLGIRKLCGERFSSWTSHVAIAVPLIAQLFALATCIVPLTSLVP